MAEAAAFYRPACFRPYSYYAVQIFWRHQGQTEVLMTMMTLRSMFVLLLLALWLVRRERPWSLARYVPVPLHWVAPQRKQPGLRALAAGGVAARRARER